MISRAKTEDVNYHYLMAAIKTIQFSTFLILHPFGTYNLFLFQQVPNLCANWNLGYSDSE